jgi:hypothetical protein
MAKVHDRIVEIVMTTANGAQTVVASAVNYYRDRGYLIAGAPFGLKAVFPAASASPYEIVLGEELPQPTIVRLTVTINA